jgi:hypothetical protein
VGGQRDIEPHTYAPKAVDMTGHNTQLLGELPINGLSDLLPRIEPSCDGPRELPFLIAAWDSRERTAICLR